MDNKAQVCFNLGSITAKLEKITKSAPVHVHLELKQIREELILIKDLIIEGSEPTIINVSMGGYKDGNKR